jgi:hypothetical protein
MPVLIRCWPGDLAGVLVTVMLVTVMLVAVVSGVGVLLVPVLGVPGVRPSPR